MAGGRANVAAIRVTLAGVDLTDRIAPRLVSLRLTEKRGGDADELELVVQNTDGRLAKPNAGALLRVSLGWTQGLEVTVGMIDKGSFTVDEVALEGPPDIYTLRARSADLDTSSYRVRKDDSHLDTTIGAIVRKVAAAHGLKASVAPALDGVAVPVLGQSAKSDMALVRELGRRHDATATVKAGALIFAPIGAGTTAGGAKIASVAIAARYGDRYSYSEVKRDAYDGVSTAYHDQDSASRETVIVGKSGGTHKRLRHTFATKADAKAAASAELNRIQRGAATLDLDLALGRPEIYPDRKATLSGFPGPIQALAWLVSEAEHSLDAQGGLRTRLKLETAP